MMMIDEFSAKSEMKRVMEETDEMVKVKAELCSKILEKQKKFTSLESDSVNLSQVSTVFLIG